MAKTFLEMLAFAEARYHSSLCVGLDPDLKRFPEGVTRNSQGLINFCRAIVDETSDKVIAFKPQFACFAAARAERELEKIIRYIHDTTDAPVILDVKRGDIGSTAEQYAIEAFERYEADAVTLSPYMGFDSIEPYLKYEGKGAFLLCRTSNSGGDDLQNRYLSDIEGTPRLFEYVASRASDKWNLNGQLGLVVGATYPKELQDVRVCAPHLPLLIPGVGAQGGDAASAVTAAWRPDAPIVINSSRSILYASHDADFAKAARRAAEQTRKEIEDAKDAIKIFP